MPLSDDLPEDPFEQNVPDFESFTGPHADEIRDLIHKFADGKLDYKALLAQSSLREIGAAIWALDEEAARKALLCAISMARMERTDRERFIRWVEDQ